MSSKGFVIGLISFCAGAGAGFLASMKYFEAKYENLANDEIASVKEVYDTKMEKMMKYYPKTEYAQENVDNRARTKPAKGELTRPPIQMNSYERAKQNYNLIRVNEAADEIEEDIEEDEEYMDEAGMTEQDHINASSGDKPTDDPYLIESDEYMEEASEFDKATLYYYRVDDVLCSQDGEDIITEIEEIVGYDAMCKLDMQTMCWVRNPRLNLDYEIIAVNGAYSDSMGKASSPRERYNKSKRRDDYEE